jgi:branched-chain amino acid transport system substrate-binding protein
MKWTKLLIATGLGACLAASSLSAAGAQTLKIGVIAPLTGPGAPWGMAAKVGAEIVAAEMNAKGGLDVGGKKYQIGVIAYDDQYKAAEAVAAYNRLINQDGVRYMIIATSAPTMALRQNVEDDKVVALTSAYAPGAIGETTKYMFRLYSTASDFVPSYVDWMLANFKERRMVTLNPNDETGWGQKQVTEKIYKEKGFSVVGGELYERSVKDFQPVLTKVLALQPDVIDLGSSAPPTAGLIVRQGRELGYKGRFVQTGGPGWAAAVEAAGKEAAEGMINVLYADPANAGFQRVTAAYKSAIGQEPNEIIVPYYDGVTVLLSAIAKGGDVNDTAKTAASFKAVLPMKSLQGDEMTYELQQIRTFDYVSVLKDGKPVVSGKIK